MRHLVTLFVGLRNMGLGTVRGETASEKHLVHGAIPQPHRPHAASSWRTVIGETHVIQLQLFICVLTCGSVSTGEVRGRAGTHAGAPPHGVPC